MRAPRMKWLLPLLAFTYAQSPEVDEVDVLHAHTVVAAAKQAKRDLDAMRKAHDIAIKYIDEMPRAARITLPSARVEEALT